MTWTFGQVEKALAERYSIRLDRRSAFANRIKNYQKAGFPVGINTGRGRAASYDIGHLIQLAVALELNQLGISPERAISVISSDLHSIAMAASLAAHDRATAGRFPHPTLLYLDPAGLSDLMREPDGDRAVTTFFYSGMIDALESMREWFTNGVSRVSFFSMSALLDSLAAFATEKRADRDAFYDSVKAWASLHIHNEPHNGSN